MQRIFQLLSLLLALLLVSGCSLNPLVEPVDPFAHLHHTPSPYYLYTPENYTAAKDWPVFVGIHPEGGSGLDCWDTWQPYADSEGFVLICPSLAEEDGSWHRQSGLIALARVLNQVAQNISLQDQFFFAGYSAGGQFVEAVLIDYSQIVSGAAILAAPYYYPPEKGDISVPVLVVIGQSDDPVALQSAQLYVEQLREIGYSVTADFPVGVDHRLTSDMVDQTIELYRRVYPPTRE